MGASQIPVPIYQYRIILPFDDKVINVATDMDFNVEGDIKAPITKNVLAKSSFLVLCRHCSLFYLFCFSDFVNIF